MKTIALALVVALPSFGWAQAANGPAYSQPDAPISRSLVPNQVPPTLEVSAAPPIYERWYFWTGAGVVLLGIIASGVLLTVSSRKAPTQYEVCGGRCDACIGLACN